MNGQEEFFSRAFLQAVGNHIGPAVLPALLALGLAAILSPVAILVARRSGFMKRPRDRDIHVRPTPDVGGLALYAAFAAAALLTVPFSNALAGTLLAGAAAVLLFFVDDRIGMPALVKLALQAAVALAAILAFPHSFQITYLTVPGLQTVQIGLLAVPLTLFWLLGMQNTVNFLDGIDGLAAGVVAIVAAVLLVAASTRGQTEVVLLAACLAGACAGFLVFNWNPARIFMGDSGSNFLGLALGLLAVQGVAKVAVAFSLVIPVLALGIPIADTVWAIVRRRRAGISMAHPDTRHIHHQLLDFGLSQREVCVVVFSATALLGAVGLTLFGHRRVLAIVMVGLVIVLSTAAADHLERSSFRLPVPWLRRLLPEPLPSAKP
ncbi:MAG TPA: MraY family glycosyltransferase [Candidatus Dormibacteraeota bacterium]